METIFYLLVLVAVVLTGGCVLTLNSLFTSKDVFYDPALEGTWQKDGTTWDVKGVDKSRGRYSLSAWSQLLSAFPQQEDAILGFLIRLDHLSRGIERAVPQARAFVRPGLDEPPV